MGYTQRPDYIDLKTRVPTLHNQHLAHDGEINFLWDSNNCHVDLGFYGTGTYSYFGCNAQGVKVLDDDVPADSSLAKPIMDLLYAFGQ